MAVSKPGGQRSQEPQGRRGVGAAGELDERMQPHQPERALVARVRRRLEEELGVALPEERVPVGRKRDGSARLHRFDLVAPDGSFVGEVRTYTLGEGGHRPAGKFAHCYAACLFLLRAEARDRALVLTDRDFWARFSRESDGLVEGVEIVHVPVDPALPIVDEPEEAEPPAPTRPRRPPAPGAPRGFERADELPRPRRNRGGPGPRGRRPNTGQRRGGGGR